MPMTGAHSHSQGTAADYRHPLSPLVEALYSNRTTGYIETEITFEDGRTGLMRAEVAIRDVGRPMPIVERLALEKAS